MTWFDDVKSWLEARIAELRSAIGPALTAFANSIVAAGADALLQIAEEAVTKVAADPTILTNSAKRDAAIAQVLGEAGNAGLKVTETAALNAIQAVYTAMKDSASAAPATP